MIKLKIDTLCQAIKENVNIELRQAETGKDEFHFYTKFLEYDIKKKTIIVGFPRAYPDLESLRTNDQIVVQFIYKETPFLFNSKVLAFTHFQLPEEEKKQAVVIALPETIFGENRREFFKVSTPRLVVDIQVIESENLEKELITKKFKAAARNISGGGIAVENKDRELPLSIGDFLDLDIHFPDEKMHIQGEVVHIYPFENSRKMICGIKFVQRTIDKLSFKRNINRIMRYVMKRERELLVRNDTFSP